tara:strand:+ start:585 stop:788 length:204 start_codon:yes stop_codon:yes gene_type:complete
MDVIKVKLGQMSQKGNCSAREADEFVYLLNRIDRCAKMYFSDKVEKSGADKKKFETDMKFFCEWFEK